MKRKQALLESNPNILHRWRRELRQFGQKAFAGPGQSRVEKQRIATLERKVGPAQNALKRSCRSMNLQPTANSALLSCLSPGDKTNTLLR